MFRAFIDEIRTQVNETWNIGDAPKFISKYTYLRGSRYSFKDHEFQETILADSARVVNTQKCSQIGMSEATARWSVAVCNMIPDFSVITTFPFAGDASDFAKTRIDPFVQSSPKLRASVNPKLNNGDIKQFSTSFLYFRGTNGKTQAISIPADCIVSDEIDRSDPHVLSQYQSRLTHSKWKLRRNFSTPTIPGFGISLEMQSSMRYKNICKCSHCARHFLPNYFEHVKIPAFDGSLRTLSKANIHKTRYMEAVLLCPHCGKEPDLGPAFREYIIENTADNFEAHGYYVSPFDAPRIISVVDLLKSSVSYSRYSEFVNQNLGLEEEDSSEALTITDMNEAFLAPGTILESSSLHAMGIDVGIICYITVGRMSLEGQMLVVHRERCPVGSLPERKLKLMQKYRIIITVMDSQPYVDLVQRLQKTDKNLYGGVYSNSKKLESFAIKMFAGDESEGKLPIHTVQINRDKGLDMLLGKFKAKEVVIAPVSEEEDELLSRQMLDMRRVQVFDVNQELTWQWVKSKDGNDHYHHAIFYLYIACQLRGTASRGMALQGVSFMSKFTVKQPRRPDESIPITVRTR